MAINNVVLSGRLANDPEMKYSTSGMPITHFRLAVDRGKKGEEGEDNTDWLNIVCFQKTAELVSQYLDKGSLIGLEGRIQSRTWEGNDGKRNYMVEIVANNIHFLESKADADKRRGGRPAPGAQQQQQAAPQGGGDEDEFNPYGDQ